MSFQSFKVFRCYNKNEEIKCLLVDKIDRPTYVITRNNWSYFVGCLCSRIFVNNVEHRAVSAAELLVLVVVKLLLV